MTALNPRYGKEHARRGTDIYERQVCRQVETGNQGRIVAIDVDSGQFEVADTSLAACERLLGLTARMPRSAASGSVTRLSIASARVERRWWHDHRGAITSLRRPTDSRSLGWS